MFAERSKIDMNMTNTLTFKIATRKTPYDALYRTKSELLFNDGNNDYSIEPSFTTFYESGVSFDEQGVILVSPRIIKDVRVRCDVSEIEFDQSTLSYNKKKYKRKANKSFHLSNDLLNYISKLQSYIYSQIIDTEFNEQDYSISFDEMDNYVVVENSKNYTIQQISQVINAIDDIDELNLSRAILLNKSLSKFKDDLTSVLDEDEHAISRVFKKHKDVLPLILLGYDATLEFEYEIKNIGDGTTKPDIFLLDDKNERITLIELKRADTKMFSGTHRVDTLKIKSDFANAIHQTNLQRTKLSQSSNKYHFNIPKSILIYGNLEQEKTDVIDEELLIKNLNILRYNNKDLIIMTYDEVLQRVDLLIENKKI